MKLHKLLESIVRDDFLHAKWLNTLSYLENCGARKIAACEHPTLVKAQMLKHAFEEFRHSHYLKKQIRRVFLSGLSNYSCPSILGGVATLQYLNKLDLFAARFFSQKMGADSYKVKEWAYLFVTYAIELRAEKFYPVYEKILREHQSKVFVKSIILEEEQHLLEMEEGIQKIPLGMKWAEVINEREEELFQHWIECVEQEVFDK